MGPREDVNWADKYKHSDHHTDRRVRTIVAYEAKTGLKFPEPLPKHINNHSKMTWGKGGSTNVVQVTTKSRRAASVPAEDLSYEPSVGSKTARAVWSALDHSNDLSLASKRQDRKLLDDIQLRMHKLEFDSVKPGRDVTVKTGFRRFIYGHKPALEEQTKIERRKDELRYPWSNRDNFYRAPRKKTGKVRGQEVKETDQPEDDHYPRHDPLGLYRPRDKKPKAIDRKDLEPATSTYRDRSTTSQLARLHAKVKGQPFLDKTTSTSASAYGGFDELGGFDFDTFYAELSRPITRSGPIDFYVPVTGTSAELDGAGEMSLDTARRIRESRAEIDEFDRLLDTTFSRPRRRPYVSQTAPPVTYRRPYSQLTTRREADDQDQVVFSPSTKRESRPRARRGATTRARRASIASVTSLPVTRRTSGVDDEDYELVFPDRLIPKRLAPCARRAYHRGFFQRSASLPPSTDDVKTRVSKMSTVGSDFIGLGSPLLRVVDVIPPPRRRMTLPYLGAEPTSASEPEVADKPPERRYDYYHDDDAIWWPWPRLTPTTRKWWPASLTGRRFSFAFGDSDAGYTPQLRLARAYQFSHPRPYVRRHVPLSLPPRSYYHVYVPEVDYVPAPITSSFRAGSEPKKFLPSASLAVRQAKNSLSRIERELGMGTVSIDDAPYFEEPVVRTTHIAPVSAVRTGWFRGGAPVSRKTSYRSHSVAARPPPVPRSTRIHEIEARLETLLVPDPVVSPVSYSSLRSRAVEARNKLDQHKVLLDRYLPVPSGPVNEVPYEVEYKFSELAERMPQLRPRERSYRASSLPPVSSVSAPPSRPIVNQYNNALRRTPFKPTMSETRKRAREVLCRTKGDPHYFDY